MNRQKDISRLSSQVLDQASEWFVEFSEDSVTAEGREEFIRWLQVSPEHVRAYLQTAAFWEDARLIDSKREAGADMLIARALAAGNVVPLELAPPTAHQIVRAYSNRRFMIAASVAMVALVGGIAWNEFLRVPSYSTDIGEQRSVRLADGSTMDLNSRSKVRIHFDAGERNVELVEGQALFDVAKDPARPFIVRSGEMSMRAVGTQFDVYRRKTGTTVTVLEGQVSVATPSVALDGASAPVLVAAGEQVMVTTLGLAEPQTADTAAATAWTRREIVFQAAPLTDVVEEFNRYNAKQLVIADASINGTRISGVFSSTDPSALLLFLRGLPEFNVLEEGDTIQITRR